MAEIILHHYDRSPFSEKVRLVFGLKGISWRAVEIPAWMPKPDLMPLTGGYRKTPVMQIGADIFCDTRIILRELDRRFPQPALDGGGGELIAAWADNALFINAVGVAFGSLADSFPKELKEDREKFTGGRFSADRFKAAQPTLRAQYRAQLVLIEETFADGRDYLIGSSPSAADFAVYHPIWFVRKNVRDPDFLAGCPALAAWRERIAKFGHGTRRPLDAKEALAIAKTESPAGVSSKSSNDLSGCHVGQQVTVAANDYGRDPVAGQLLAIDDAEIIIRRHDPLVGDLNIHFPRVGFDVAAGSKPL
ncbi:MAG TPA: glutathione S-transferase family protein [Xanthobacteraceae bacterium]|nr:glutathione S-transferase family protein [Xanthobacteraceae bacterium]